MRLAVVIPTLGRTQRLARTLAALERQTVGDFEVVVVRDPQGGPVDPGRRPYPIRLLESPVPGASAARNTGWRATAAPVVLFLGDDIIAAPRLIEGHLAWRADDTVVVGDVRWADELDVTPFMRWLDRGIQFDFGAIEGDRASWFNCYTANVSIPRPALDRVNGFDAERFPFLYEDLDLGYRLDGAGVRFRYHREAAGEHLHPTTVGDWKRRMSAVASAERRWTDLRPEMPAYFHDRFAAAAARPPATGLGRPLLRWLAPTTPLLGRHAWTSADVYYSQQLAPAFLEQWERDQAAVRTPRR